MIIDPKKIEEKILRGDFWRKKEGYAPHQIIGTFTNPQEASAAIAMLPLYGAFDSSSKQLFDPREHGKSLVYQYQEIHVVIAGEGNLRRFAEHVQFPGYKNYLEKKEGIGEPVAPPAPVTVAPSQPRSAGSANPLPRIAAGISAPPARSTVLSKEEKLEAEVRRLVRKVFSNESSQAQREPNSSMGKAITELTSLILQEVQSNRPGSQAEPIREAVSTLLDNRQNLVRDALKELSEGIGAILTPSGLAV